MERKNAVRVEVAVAVGSYLLAAGGGVLIGQPVAIALVIVGSLFLLLGIAGSQIAQHRLPWLASVPLVAQPRAQDALPAAAAFKDFVRRFAGWFKSHEIGAPPDMSEVLDGDGDQYQKGLVDKVVSGELSGEEAERRLRPLTERREWVKNVRVEYQRDWRAEVARWLEWARESGAIERDDRLALLLVENPWPDDLKELVASVERMAGRL